MFKDFPVTDEEYNLLDKKFGDLCHYASWQLLRKNVKNNHTDDQEDISQELHMSLLVAGSYYKRQVYIENCFLASYKYIKDTFTRIVFMELNDLWKNKTKHGAGRQKFGARQEELLENIVQAFVPVGERPDKKAPLKMDLRFINYCKAITWNSQRHLGKKITREKSIRTGQVSLSEYDYLSGELTEV